MNYIWKRYVECVDIWTRVSFSALIARRPFFVVRAGNTNLAKSPICSRNVISLKNHKQPDLLANCQKKNTDLFDSSCINYP